MKEMMTFGLMMCFICMVTTVWDKFNENHLRPLRAGMYAFLAFCGSFPAYHWFGKNSWTIDQLFVNFWLQCVFYLFGAILYSVRVPERLFPGKCDFWFQSHQIFHVMVLIALFYHYLVIYEMAYDQLTIVKC